MSRKNVPKWLRMLGIPYSISAIIAKFAAEFGISTKKCGSNRKTNNLYTTIKHFTNHFPGGKNAKGNEKSIKL